MNFAKLFGKKDKGGGKAKQDNVGQTTLNLDQKIKDLELKIYENEKDDKKIQLLNISHTSHIRSIPLRNIFKR